MRIKIIYLLSLLTLIVAFLPGCAQHKTTSVTETEVHRDSNIDREYSSIDGEYRARYVEPDSDVTTRTETTTTEVKEDNHRGVFGIIGDIIALPFRAVGALFTAIF